MSDEEGPGEDRTQSFASMIDVSLRAAALEHAVAASHPGAMPTMILFTARKFEEYLVGYDPSSDPSTLIYQSDNNL